MDKLVAMTTFVRIVEAGSLTAAADRLDASLPTVVRTLAALERHRPFNNRAVVKPNRHEAIATLGREQLRPQPF